VLYVGHNAHKPSASDISREVPWNPAKVVVKPRGISGWETKIDKKYSPG